MNHTSPPFRRLPTPPWQRERLSHWLHEWSIAEHLGEEADGPHVAGKELPMVPGDAPLVSPTDSSPAVPGQIRLLRPSTPAAFRRPVYVAVLRGEPDDHCLAAPFGPFAVPATPGEWTTGRSVPVLRVLCLWNARAMPAASLGNSWIVDSLTASELPAALAVFSHAASGTCLPRDLLNTVGPPVQHPDDPREAYLARYSAFMDMLIRELAASYLVPDEEEHRKAAEPPSDYETTQDQDPTADT